MVKDLVLSLPWPKFNPWSQLRFHKGPGAAKKKKKNIPFRFVCSIPVPCAKMVLFKNCI